jgi:HEPN domain-containing protein
MSAEDRRWLAYAHENLRAATLCLGSNLFNPCLQNAQQAVEKALKALHLFSGLP